jgi:hypothetical protein
MALVGIKPSRPLPQVQSQTASDPSLPNEIHTRQDARRTPATPANIPSLSTSQSSVLPSADLYAFCLSKQIMDLPGPIPDSLAGFLACCVGSVFYYGIPLAIIIAVPFLVLFSALLMASTLAILAHIGQFFGYVDSITGTTASSYLSHIPRLTLLIISTTVPILVYILVLSLLSILFLSSLATQVDKKPHDRVRHQTLSDQNTSAIRSGAGSACWTCHWAIFYTKVLGKP